MRYTYTVMFKSNAFVSCGVHIGSFCLFQSGSLYTVGSKIQELPGKVTGDFGVKFGCNVLEVERIAGGIIVRCNRRLKSISVDEKPSTWNPPTDADLEEAALAAREDWSAVECKEDWTMVTA